MRPLPLSFVLLLSCSNLPEGWEGAQRVADLVQRECEGSPYEGTHDERIEAVPGEDLDRLSARQLHFRCAQDVTAYQLDAGDELRVLVQPLDMTPSMVTSCDCLYDLDITLDVESAPAAVGLWRRWDELNDDNDPVFIGRLPGDGGVDTDVADTDPPT